jgi:hypothetical protein
MINKENILSDVLSVENLSRLYFEFNFTKLLLFDSIEIKGIKDIYSDILNDRYLIKSLRKVIYERFDATFYLKRLNNMDTKEKIDLFLRKKS